MESSNNWIKDEVVKTYNDHWNQKEELIKQLTIQKIEYGRRCMAEFLLRGGQTRQTMAGYHMKKDCELQDKIIELGGKPQNIFLKDAEE